MFLRLKRHFQVFIKMNRTCSQISKHVRILKILWLCQELRLHNSTRVSIELKDLFSCCGIYFVFHHGQFFCVSSLVVFVYFY